MLTFMRVDISLTVLDLKHLSFVESNVDLDSQFMKMEIRLETEVGYFTYHWKIVIEVDTSPLNSLQILKDFL